jgi:hypothetical protein
MNPLQGLGFKTFDFELTWWRLFQKRAVRTTFDSYIIISTLLLQIYLSSPPGFLVGPVLFIFFLVLSYYVFLRPEFCIVMSITISA